MSHKKNLFILLIVLFASMHNPAFGMKRPRATEDTEPASKRRMLTHLYQCLTCQQRFHDSDEMHEHFVQTDDHDTYAIATSHEDVTSTSPEDDTPIAYSLLDTIIQTNPLTEENMTAAINQYRYNTSTYQRGSARSRPRRRRRKGYALSQRRRL